MEKLISAILYTYGTDIAETKESRMTMAGRIADVIRSQYIIKSKTQREPEVSKADKKNDDTAVVRLSKQELWILCNELKNKDLSDFFGNLYNKLEEMKQEQIDIETKARGVDFCEPGVNCE